MFGKYTEGNPSESNAGQDEIGKINLRLEHWENALGKTNEDIRMLKDMVCRLESMALGEGGVALELTAASGRGAEGRLQERLAVKEKEVSSLQEAVGKLEEEKLLYLRRLDEMEAKISGKNKEIERLRAAAAELEQQSRQGGDLATKLNNKKISAMSTLIENLGGEKKRQEQKIEDLTLALKQKDAEMQELKEKNNALTAEFAQMQANLKARDEKAAGELTAKEQENGVLREQICALTVKNDEKKDLIDDLKNTLLQREQYAATLDEKIRGLKEENARRERQAAELTRKIGEKDQEIQSLHTMLACSEEEKGRKMQQIEKLNQAVASLQQQSGRLGHWNEAYHPLMEKIYACMALKAFIEENGLGSEVSLETTLQFIRCIGDDYGFAARIHHAFAVYKREIQEPVMPREVEVYKAINTYYRKMKGISYDIFMFPNGLSVDDRFCEGMEFDKEEVKDMMSEESDGFKTIRCVFVPVLKDAKGNTAAKGIVKGDADELF